MKLEIGTTFSRIEKSADCEDINVFAIDDFCVFIK